MLCPSCICKRLADRGFRNVPAVFRSGPCFVYPAPSDAAPVAVGCENCKTLEQWVHDLQSGMFINCVYCGHRYGPDDEVAPTMQQALYDHIAKCPKHPLSAMKRRAERAEARLAHPEDAPGGPWWEFGAGDFIHQGDRILRGCDLTREELTVVRDALNRVDRTKGDDEHGS